VALGLVKISYYLERREDQNIVKRGNDVSVRKNHPAEKIPSRGGRVVIFTMEVRVVVVGTKGGGKVESVRKEHFKVLGKGGDNRQLSRLSIVL